MSFLAILVTIGTLYFIINNVVSLFEGSSDRPSEDSWTNNSIPTLEKSLVFLLASIMMADGKATKSELLAVKKFLANHYSEEDAKKLLLFLREELKNFNMSSSIDIRPYCIRINQLAYEKRLLLLSTLFQVAVADGDICNAEARLIQLYARFTLIRTVDFAQMQNYYTYGYRWEEQQDNRKYKGNYQSNRNTTTNNANDRGRSWACKVLGVPENASESDVKKAYRKLALQYHPDKQIGKSEEEIKAATNKFREINEAYEMLTKK